MGRGWVGRRVARKEDYRFLTGQGRFTDDLAEPGAAWAQMVRSPYAHARILDVDASHAITGDGVLAVLCGRDIEGEIAPVPTLARTPPFARLNRDGSPMPDPCQPALATTRVRYAGEPVAIVVAETEAAARDAAEAVAVEYEPLSPVITYGQARTPDVSVWDDLPANVTFDREQGDREATEAAFAVAAHVVELTLVNNRVTPVFLEPRRRHRKLRPGDRDLDPDARVPDRARHARDPRRDAGHRPRAPARGGTGHGWRVRGPRDTLSRVRRAPCRGEAYRQDRALDGDPRRELPERRPVARSSAAWRSRGGTGRGGLPRSAPASSGVMAHTSRPAASPP